MAALIRLPRAPAGPDTLLPLTLAVVCSIMAEAAAALAGAPVVPWVTWSWVFRTALLATLLGASALLARELWRSGWRSAARTVLGRAPEAAALTLAALLTMRAFIRAKAAIPLVVPFYLDPALAQLDSALHFGVDPWRLIQPLLGHPPVTRFVDFLYSQVWLALLAYVPIAWAWLETGRRRARIFTAFFLCWFGMGVLMAMMMSSVGPVFYHQIFADSERFRPLLTYLGEISEKGSPLQVIEYQRLLWESYQGNTRPVNGISAMPSMHVAMAALYFLTSPSRLRWLSGAYALFVLLGSVHLGWHYAIDGYVAAVIALLAWRCAAQLLDRVRVESRDMMSSPAASRYSPTIG